MARIIRRSCSQEDNPYILTSKRLRIIADRSMAASTDQIHVLHVDDEPDFTELVADLDTEEMQAIAAEIDYSETTSVTGDPSVVAWAVRIFSSTAEVPSPVIPPSAQQRDSDRSRYFATALRDRTSISSASRGENTRRGRG